MLLFALRRSYTMGHIESDGVFRWLQYRKENDGKRYSGLLVIARLVRRIMRKISSMWHIDYSDVNSYEEYVSWLISIRITIQTQRNLPNSRENNMKLNSKKCTFGEEEGMFLGHVVNTEGIKACPEKADVVVKLQSPRTLKEVQSLNRKLARLNIFLSKYAEKLIPFFKTLKRCIKKSNFQWTLKAEKAFE
ncbi:hypothetical protein Tco_1359851 [Tanacetum coccineum]